MKSVLIAGVDRMNGRGGLSPCKDLGQGLRLASGGLFCRVNGDSYAGFDVTNSDRECVWVE